MTSGTGLHTINHIMRTIKLTTLLVCAAACTTAAAQQFKMPEIARLKTLLANVSNGSKASKPHAPESATAKPTQVSTYNWNLGSEE